MLTCKLWWLHFQTDQQCSGNIFLFGSIKYLYFKNQSAISKLWQKCLHETHPVFLLNCLNSFYPSIWDYVAIIHRCAATSTLKPLSCVYYSALRFITGEPYGTQHWILYDKDGWSSLVQRLNEYLSTQLPYWNFTTLYNIHTGLDCWTTLNLLCKPPHVSNPPFCTLNILNYLQHILKIDRIQTTPTSPNLNGSCSSTE